LTADSTASFGGYGDLYRFEPEGSGASRLVDLTVDTTDPGGAEVLGVLGASADGSSLYFVANGVLGGDPRASRGNCTPGSSPEGAHCNLYLWHEGWAAPRFIARLSGRDELEEEGRAGVGAAYDWAPSADVRTARVSRSGNRVAFMSQAGLTGYDNTVSGGTSCPDGLERGVPPAQCEEVFLYEANTNRLSCVSCNPSGARPTGPSGIPGGTQISNLFALYQSRVLSEAAAGSTRESEEGGRAEGGARVFFDSVDGLSPTDTNGVEDVYEWEAQGAGGCARPGGCISLLSGGVSTEPSSFVDASTNGSDVFFVTSQQLARGDIDQLADLYDTREGGGFPQASVTACTGSGCQGVPSVPPTFATPSTVTFTGVGNHLPEPSGAPPVKHKALTRAQRLAKALKACRAKKDHRKRAACKRAARKRFGPIRRRR
jgi:hypothetical protein